MEAAAAAAEKIDYAVTENTEILLDLGPVDSVGYKISDREDNIVLTSNHAQDTQPKTIYACHVCDEIFNDNNEMLDHFSDRHEMKFTQILPSADPTDSQGEPDYISKATSTVTSSQCTRDIDIRLPYKCAHCGERFKRGSEVGAHMFKHSSTLQYFCDFCPIAFEVQSDLDEHVGLFHSGQKENLMNQHRCGHCGVSFSHRNSLYKHIKCHRDTFSVISENKAKKGGSSLVKLTGKQSSLIKKKKAIKTRRSQNFNKYACKFCYSKFQTKDSLTKHVSTHPEWNPAICEVCGEHFAIEVDLKIHQRIHKRKCLPCKMCSRVFTSHKRLEKHMDIIHSGPGNKRTQIKIIKVASSNKNNQICSNKKSRTALNHQNSKSKTLIKDKKSTSKENKDHSSKSKPTTKSPNLSVSCSVERLTYKTVKELTVESSNYKCDVCTKSFPLLKELTAHMNKLHCATQQKFDCEYCDRSFSQRLTYFNHLLKHYKKGNYSCQQCSLDFKDARQLKEHMQSSGRHKHTYTCSLCSKVFDDQLSRKRHREIAHPSATIFKCNICSRQFESEKQRKKHLQLHTVKKQHQCDICAQTFSRLSLLFQHLVTHAQKIMYKCRFCPRLFRNQMSMHKHLSVHTHLKSSKVCTVCQKTFQKSENLSKHLETHLHDGALPFTCCNKTFTQVQEICNHLKLKSHDN